jgi:hypothetical protein
MSEPNELLVPWYRWNRMREKALWRFFGRWFLSPFVGFRHRWESAVYYLTLLLGVSGKYVVKILDLPLTQDELLWRLPLAVVAVIGVYRFVLFPYHEYAKAERRAEEIGAVTGEPEERRDRIFALAAQLERFVEERNAGDPAIGDHDALQRYSNDFAKIIGPKWAASELQEHQTKVATYHSATMDYYDSHFAERVARTTRELRKLGFSDARLEGYPKDILEVNFISKCLLELAARIEQPKIDQQARPKVVVIFDWHGSHLDGCYEPLVLKNESDIPAQKVKIGDIVNADKQSAHFQLIGYLDAREQRQVWPNIDGAGTRSGHPDFAKFIWTAQISEGLACIRNNEQPPDLKAGFALPFAITYRDLSGKDWRTNAHVKIGGEWGPGRIVVETLGFG